MPPRFGGSWARTTPANDLTPEEERLRKTLQKTTPAASHKPTEQRERQPANQLRPRVPRSDGGLGSARYADDNAFNNWDCSCGYTNYQGRKECLRCQKPASSSALTPQPVLAPGGQQRESKIDEHIAKTKAAQVRTPNGFNLEGSKENGIELAQSWKHLKRRSGETSVPATDDKAASGLSSSVESENPTGSDSGTKRSILGLERLARLEETKSGRYIGLHTDNLFRKTGERFGHQDTTNQKRGGNAESNLISEGTQNPGDVPSVKQRSMRPQGTEGTGFAKQIATKKSDFDVSKGSWSRWKPYPVEDPAAAVPSQAKDLTSTRTRPDHVERPSIDAAPTNPRWTSWTPPYTEKYSGQAPIPDESRAYPQEPVNGGYRHAPSERTSSNQFAEQHSDQSERREGRKLTKKERRVNDDPIDEFQMAPRSFKAESSSYTREGGRNKIRRKQRKFESEHEDDEDDRIAAKIERKQQRKKERAMLKQTLPPTPIYLPEFISVSNLAAVLRVRVEEFVDRMEALGFEETNNDHVLDAEVAGLIAAEFNFEPIFDYNANEDLKARPPAEDKSLLPPRPPVVTIMGHVDHGKTTLLDWLRKSSVAASEYGGITQHIGAFSVQMPSGKIITFLDTPGHAAFLSMRQRGAHVTDIVILVVAADDSVKPQTIEAIKHAQAAKVPIIVAVNKIDKEDANVERVKQDLARYGVEIEDYGGDTQVVCVSGKTGLGMEELEDAAVALADILDMRAEIDGQAEGWVLEATTKKAGRVATVLVRRGTLRPCDVIVAGTTWARVRSLKNEAGVQIPFAGPGTPVEIDGWRGQPAAGDEVLQANDEQQAKSVVELRLEDLERSQMAADMTAVNEARRLEQEKREAAEKAEDDAKNADPEAPTATPIPEQESPKDPTGPKEVFFLIKADVSGSVEAVAGSVSALGSSEVRPHLLRSAVGPVSEFDIEHAAAAKGHIIAFNVPSIQLSLRRMAEASGVRLLEENIIYRCVDEVKGVLSEMLAPLVTQRVLGEAEVAQVFEINVRGRIIQPVAGCRVRNGVINKNAKVRVLRGKDVVYDGTSLPIPFPFSVLSSPCSFYETLTIVQEPSHPSKTSRKTSLRCARATSAAWDSRSGRTSRPGIKSRLMRRRSRGGICN